MSLQDTAAILKIDRKVAKDALRDYHAAKGPRTKEDVAIMQAYKAIGQGKAVIDVRASIREAGWNLDGTTKLAMTRADVTNCHGSFSTTVVSFCDRASRMGRAEFRVDAMPRNPVQGGGPSSQALVPLIPLPLRPQSDLANYWILWEADWKVAPRDPLLLRKLEGDLYIVLAAWDLTDVERAVLSRRLIS